MTTWFAKDPSERPATFASVDVDELIAKAWGAVQNAGVPEPVQAVALKEAIDFLVSGGGSGSSEKKRTTTRKPRVKQGNGSAAEESASSPNAADFYAHLADESGVDEATLRDVLQFKGDAIHVIPPTRKLGDSKANQARHVVALVGGAYAHGLDRSPVDAVAVRDEVKRKRCFDTANFAAQLKSMKGFSQGSNRNEIMVGSKWLSEFQDAIKLATGDADSEEK